MSGIDEEACNRINLHFHKQYVKQHGFLQYKGECVKLNCKPLLTEDEAKALDHSTDE